MSRQQHAYAIIHNYNGHDSICMFAYSALCFFPLVLVCDTDTRRKSSLARRARYARAPPDGGLRRLTAPLAACAAGRLCAGLLPPPRLAAPLRPTVLCCSTLQLQDSCRGASSALITVLCSQHASLQDSCCYAPATIRGGGSRPG